MLIRNIIRWGQQYRPSIWLANRNTANFSQKPNKKYILSQFPYPSGELHLGHARVYYIGDSLARYYRLKKYHVIYPIAFDSFGLPAQNAAILHNLNPEQWTNQNIKAMTRQLNYLGIQFDWDCTFATSNHQYYRFTQQIFLRMFKKGLAYKGLGEVNWDPVDKTVLANEQVDMFGRSWRSGALVQKRQLNQWYLSISKYAKDLQMNLQNLDLWIDRVKSMQQGWIGYKEGYFVEMTLISPERQGNKKSIIKVFIKNLGYLLDPEITIKQSITREQKGDKYLNYNVVNPLTNKNIRLSTIYDNTTEFEAFPNEEKDSGKVQELSKGQLEQLKYQKTKIMRLKDWLISRQRFWGTPIPIIYCKQCGTVPVPESKLPVMLPKWQGKGNPLLSEEFINCKCPKCNGPATRETDTMDTFVDSSWYYLRFLDSHNKQFICDPEKSNKMMPVDIYIGGIEHAIMHLLYARFIMFFLSQQQRVCKQKQPFKELIVQGLVKGRTIKHKQSGKYLKQHQKQQYKAEQLEQIYEKMSKSKFNGVNPVIMVQKYGCDALRMALFFAAPPQSDIDFNTELLVTIQKFLAKVSELVYQFQALYKTGQSDRRSRQQLNNVFPDLFYNIKQIIEKMQISLEKRSMHVYIGNLMQLFNEIKKQHDQYSEKPQINEALSVIIRDILLPSLSIVAPETITKIEKQCQIDISQLQWVSSHDFINVTQYLVMKGKKLLRQGIIAKSFSDQQIWQKIKGQFASVELQKIKRNKKNIIVIVK